MQSIKQKTADSIVHWYQNNKRALPWRDTGNPYDTWISEIMLQQTRIQAVLPKYTQFMNVLKDIPSLASCNDDDLMRLWEGLGYYSRARNLKKCAQVLVQEYDSRLPADYQALLKLPGIGPYTAGAIASIAFDLAESAVDGNVLRVLARYQGIRDDVRLQTTKDAVEASLMSVYQHQQKEHFFADFNQGLMEIGEVVCMPNGAPHCEECPLRAACQARKDHSWDVIPYRSPLKDRKIIERTLLILRDGDSFLLHKRKDKGLLAGLYEFPGIDQYLSEHEVLKKTEMLNAVPLRIKHLPDAKHIFTHLEWHMHAYEVQVEQMDPLLKEGYVLADKKELSSLAIPSAFKVYLDWYALRDQ